MWDARAGPAVGALLGGFAYAARVLFPELSTHGGSGFLTALWSTVLWFGGVATPANGVLTRGWT